MPSSVNLLFFTTCSCSCGAFIMPGFSVTERCENLGQGHSTRFVVRAMV